MPNDNLKLKNTAVIVFLGFLMLVIVYSLFFGPLKKFADSLMPARTITVSAEGKAIVSPDIAKIYFSVISEGIQPEQIVNENNRKINAAINFIKSEGIEEKDIKTVQYNLQPKYEYNEKTGKNFISGYTLTQMVLVKIHDLSKTGKILGGLPKLGINEIGPISFDIDNSEKYLIEARNQAFDKAKSKAKEMAEKNGVKLDKVVDFYEYQGAPVSPLYSRMSKENITTAVPVLPTIEAGTQEVTVTVSVTYQIK